MGLKTAPSTSPACAMTDAKAKALAAAGAKD